MENNKKFKYIFGPVPSRRLGMSLGVDLMPHKTCSLDCIYCECGKTTDLTIKREEYIPLKDIINELTLYLQNPPEIDYITFSGSGEPTLHNKTGEVIEFIKTNFPQYKIALLTNSTLFYDKKVREEVKNVDLIMASLDAASLNEFNKINRPHNELVLPEIVNGLIELRKEFENTLCLEVFIVPGINDSEKELKEIKKISEKINPDMVQINSLDRPGTEEWVNSIEKERLTEIADFIQLAKPVSEFKYSKKINQSGDHYNLVLGTIKRRPCTIEDISQSLSLEKSIVEKQLNILVKKGIAYKREMKRGTFYTIR